MLYILGLIISTLFILWYDYTPNLYFWQVIKHNFVCSHHFFWKSESDESILSADKNCLTEKDMIEAEKLTAEEAAAELERIAKETARQTPPTIRTTRLI